MKRILVYTAICFASCSIGIIAGRISNAPSTKRVAEMKRLDDHCKQVKNSLQAIIDNANGSDMQMRSFGSSMFDTFVVKDDKQGIRLCVDNSKWNDIDPEDKALFCSDSMKDPKDMSNKNHACMVDIAKQALNVLDPIEHTSN